jgi:Activator of Hsp90 ATPase homolog 1-like protein
VIEPLSLSFEVDCSPEHAFDVWVRRTSLWWPADHTVTGEQNLEIVIEPRVGGRIFERTSAGTEEDWGEVTAWEPPRRLAYLWHFRTERADATEVEVSFTETESGSTRVQIDHRGWERLGERAPAWRERNQRGWETLLPHFTAAANPVPVDRGGTDGTR